MKINLFFFISNFNFGGAGNAILNFLKNLDNKKYNLHIIFLGRSDYEKLLPKNVKYYKLTNDFYFFKTFFAFFKIRNILSKKNLSNTKNIFISNIHYSNVLTVIFLRKIKNLKIVLFEITSLKELDIFTSFFTFLKNKIVKSFIKSTYSKADKVLVNSKVLGSELKNFSVKSSVMYSGSINKIVKRQKKTRKNFFNIIAVGRLTPQKDHLTLLKAIKKVKNKNFLLKIYGDGELKKNLIRYIENNNLKSHVKLLGHENKLSKIYTKADLLVHTAIFEGLPNVVVEAMSNGIPVIASNSYGGTKEILNSGRFGGLFKPGNVKQLCSMLDDFLMHPNKFYQKVSKSNSFLNRFTQKNSSKSLEKILMSI